MRWRNLCARPVGNWFATVTGSIKPTEVDGLLGFEHLQIPVYEDQTLFNDVEGTLAWLNQKPDPDHWDVVKKSLRRQIFTLPKDINTKRSHALEVQLL